MKNLNFSTRLVLGFAIPIFLLVVITIISLISASDVRSSFTRTTEVDLPIIKSLGEIRYQASRIISSGNEFVLDAALGSEVEEEDDDDDDDGGEAGEIEEATEAYYQALAQYRMLVDENTPTDLDLFTAVETNGQELIDVANLLLTFDEDSDVAEMAEVREGFEELEEGFLEAIDAAVAREDASVLESQTSIENSITNLTALSIGVSVFATVFTTGAGLLISRSIIQPVNKLQTVTKALQSGDMSKRAEIESNDEIGQLGQTFNEMADHIESLIGELQHELKEAETARAEAERSEQVKSAFLASMSHELRTPLNAIINFTKFVVAEDLGPVNKDQKDTLNDVVGSGKHLLNLINDVLDMSKIEAGSLNLFITDDIDITAIINQVVSTGKVLIEDKPIEIQTDIANDLPHLRGDRQRITQSLLNIMSNACKITRSNVFGGKIRAGTR